MAASDEIDSRDKDFFIPSWGYSSEGISINVQMRTARLNIDAEFDGCHQSPKALERLVRMKQKFASHDLDDEADAFEYCYELASYFLPKLRTFTPQASHIGKITLADLAIKRAHRVFLKFIDEKAVPGDWIEEDPEIQESDYDYNVLVPNDLPFPKLDLHDVEVLYDDPATVYDVPAQKVWAHGQQMFWKPSWESIESLRAVEKYRKIREAGHSRNTLLTSQLYGLVVDRRGAIRGQLYYWIDIGHHLTWKLLEQTSIEIRTKWVSQIRSTVSALHAIEVLWEDVKAENVVIDKEGNALVIDLEGGATKGWVDRDVMGTLRGDMQGLERLYDYLINDNCPLRVRDKELDLRFEDACRSQDLSSTAL